MAGLSLGGLASGMDTDAVISQLMAIEGQGKTRLLAQQYKTEARKTALDQIATRLRSLKTATEDLKSVATWGNTQKVETSDAAKVGATFKSGAAIGIYSIEVTQLARAEQRFFDYTDSASDTTINLKTSTDPADLGVTIDIPAGDVDAAAAAINAKTDSPAYASVVEGQLVLSGKKTGMPLIVSGSQVAEDGTKFREHRLAKYSIDGDPQLDSPSNTVTSLTGVELQLKGLTTSPVTVSVGAVGPDETKLKEKVKAFVDAYNSTIDLIKSKTEEKAVANPQFQSDYAKGALRGDPGLIGLMSRLRQTVSSVFEGNPDDPNPDAYNQLSDIGVGVPSAQTGGGTVSADRLAGKLVIDDAKLTEALSDPVAVRRLLGGLTGIDGASQGIVGLLDPVVRTGGEISQRVESITREVSRIKDRQLDMDKRLELKEARLRAQFVAMETALSQSQSSMSWLTSQLSGLSTGS